MFRRNVTYLGILQIVSYVVPLLIIPHLTKSFGIEGYGEITAAISLMTFLGIFIDFGFHLTAPLLISRNRSNIKIVSSYINHILVAKLLIALIMLLLIFLIAYILLDDKQTLLLYILAACQMTFQSLIPIPVFQGLEQMKIISRIGIISRVSILLLSFILIAEASNIYLYSLIYTTINLIMVVVGYKMIFQQFPFKDFKIRFRLIKKLIQFNLSFFLSRLAVGSYTSINTYIIGLVANHETAGIYNIAEKIYLLIQQLFQPIVQTLYPYISRTKDLKFFKKIFGLSFLFYILIYIGIRQFGLTTLQIIFPNQAMEIFGFTKIFLIVLFLSVPSIFLGYPFLGALGKSKIANISVICASIWHILMLGILNTLNLLNPYNILLVLISTQGIDLLIRGTGALRVKL